MQPGFPWATGCEYTCWGCRTPDMAKRQVSDSHKKAMAQGRTEGRAVKNYLTALEENKPKRGRKRTDKYDEDRKY